MSRMPNFYRPPLNLPFNWHDEVSGELPRAVAAYLDNRIDGSPLTYAQIVLLREYLVHYIDAPCWDNPEFANELLDLRKSAREIESAGDIAEWVLKGMDIGLDPL
jgi:hypothetical protein